MRRHPTTTTSFATTTAFKNSNINKLGMFVKLQWFRVFLHIHGYHERIHRFIFHNVFYVNHSRNLHKVNNSKTNSYIQHTHTETGQIKWNHKHRFFVVVMSNYFARNTKIDKSTYTQTHIHPHEIRPTYTHTKITYKRYRQNDCWSSQFKNRSSYKRF